MRSAVLAILVVLMAITVGIGPGVADETDASEDPTIVAAYPNPVAGGDAGEHVVVAIPEGAAGSNATLTDGSTSVSLSNRSAGRIALSRTPAAAREVTDLPVREASGLQLANGGESLSIRAHGEVVHSVRYEDAPEGEMATWNGSAITWRPLGATDRPVARAGPGEVRAFVLPDAAEVPRATLEAADDRLWLAGYTLTSERITDSLVAAERGGVDVRVLVEGAPIGGRTQAGAARLDRLAEAGVDVRVLGGTHARYDVHHPKYAVVDDRALVLTENWKPSGTGGNSSRGWGVVSGQSTIVTNLSATFEADADWRDAIAWPEHRAGQSFDRAEPSVGSYPRNHDPARVAVNETELLVAPDNARGRILDVLDDAEESVDVVQVELGGWDDPFAVALRRAATRGVEVRVLLSGAWYTREDNQALVDRFEEWAERADAPMSVRLAESGTRFEKIHAKGAIVDDRVVVGSLNWNDHAARNNREVVTVLHGREAAGYYRSVFATDWGGDGEAPLPVGVLVGVGGVVALAGAVLVRVKFERGWRE